MPISPSRQLRDEVDNFGLQRGKLIGQGVPDQLIVDKVVTVRNDVSKIDDCSIVGDLRRQRGICLEKAAQRHANDLELPFDREPQYLICLIVGEVLSRGKSFNSFSAGKDIM